MDFRKLPEYDLASLAENIADLLAGPELVSIDPAVRTSLIAAIGTLPATLRTETDAVDEIEGQRMAATSKRNDAKTQLETAMAQVKSALKTGLAPKKEYDLCLLDYPSTPIGVYVAQAPTELSGAGVSNGVNTLKFTGNNKHGMVVYEVYRREGDEGPWVFMASTRRQQYEDKPVEPGHYYEYRVRAVAAKTVSVYSNTAMVYGSL